MRNEYNAIQILSGASCLLFRRIISSAEQTAQPAKYRQLRFILREAKTLELLLMCSAPSYLIKVQQSTGASSYAVKYNKVQTVAIYFEGGKNIGICFDACTFLHNRSDLTLVIELLTSRWVNQMEVEPGLTKRRKHKTKLQVFDQLLLMQQDKCYVRNPNISSKDLWTPALWSCGGRT